MLYFAKFYRFYLIYGFRRSIIKAAGRLRNPLIRLFFPELFIKRSKVVSLIGCGQFGFSTISFFLLIKKENVFLECFDIDNSKSKSAADFYGFNECDSAQKLIENPKCKILYIASNHHSHTDYAVKGLRNNKSVYIEKPVSVNWEQFSLLLDTIKKESGKLYVGYNRPFSTAIRSLPPFLGSKLKPLSLSCFIIGHKIEKAHWYRDEREGTRICGNVGHWLDLTVHLMNMRGHIPSVFNVSISYSSEDEFDDNIAINLTTCYKDLVSIILTGRNEPFEGINETINLQCGNVNVKIDDFRNIAIWEDENLIIKKFKPKDVGHSAAIMQPFPDAPYERDFSEVEISTVLMLSIADMVKKLDKNKIIKPLEILARIKSQELEAV